MCNVSNMTEQRRAFEAHSTEAKATGSRELETMRAADVPLVEFVKAGGFRGFTPADLFPERAA